MCDFEDACSPTWANVIEGQREPPRRRPAHDRARDGREALRAERRDGDARRAAARLAPRRAPRRRRRDGRSRRRSSTSGLPSSTTPRSCSSAAAGRTSTCRSSRAATRRACGRERSRSPRRSSELPSGSIRCTVLIETILAAFEMDAILYELRDYGCALNAGRWDYIFSAIKKLGAVLPDRAQVTMTVPFMRAYTELLVRSCHRRGAHAIGGMAAFIPSRRDPEVNERRAREGARGQGARVRRRLRRHLGCTPGSRPGRDGGLRRRARRAPEPARAAARRRHADAAALVDFASRAARSPRQGSARTSRSAPATSTPGSTAPARPRSTT